MQLHIALVCALVLAVVQSLAAAAGNSTESASSSSAASSPSSSATSAAAASSPSSSATSASNSSAASASSSSAPASSGVAGGANGTTHTNGTGTTNTTANTYDEPKLRAILGSNDTKKFEVGMRLPNTSFDIPPSWAGNLPVSNKSDETRNIYFWMFPATGDVGHDDVVFWMNGGPGCSALSSLMGENGPLSFDPVTYVAKPAPQTWTKLANIVWIDQPAGTGFALGAAKNQSMEEVAEDFNGFLLNLYKTFPKLHGKRMWIGGESFAGKFVPFMADQIYKNETENKAAGMDLQGILITDPLFAPNVVTKDVGAVEFGLSHAKLLNFTQEQVQELEQIGEQNGISTFMRDNLVYPPKGPIQLPKQLNASFSPYKHLQKILRKNNPCTSPYYILNKACSVDALGMNATVEKSSATNYFNNMTGVKEFIHAPTNVSWMQCASDKPFKTMKNAKTGYPVPEVLSRVIEKSNRTMVGHGTYDFVVLYNGTALALQNMTWHGKQGFQSPPKQKLLTNGQEEGYYQTERGLTFFVLEKAGHMLPRYAPGASFRLLEYLLGQKTLEQLND